MTRRLLAAALLVVGLTGCATGPFEPVDVLVPSADVTIQRASQAADQLARALKKNGYSKATILVGTVAHVDSLTLSTSVGRSISEQVGARLAARGLTVGEVKLRDTLYVSTSGGEFLLSRDASKIGEAYRADVAVVGTFAPLGAQHMVTLKAVDTVSGLVISGVSFSVPRQDVWRREH